MAHRRAETMTTPFTPKPALAGSLVTLRPIRSDDADTINVILAIDDEITRPTGSIHSSNERADDIPLERKREGYVEWIDVN